MNTGSPSAPRIFLSYARSDLPAALDLRARLEESFGPGSVWQDITGLKGDHWWAETEDSLRATSTIEHLVLLASADALARSIVVEEWRLARREGKSASHVFWSDRPDFHPPQLDALPDFVAAKSMYDLSLPGRFDSLLERLKAPGRGPRRPDMSPPTLHGVIPRPDEFKTLKQAVLDRDAQSVGLTAALRGAGGFGKTVLAQLLTADEDIQDAFYDGILWVTLGEQPNLIEKLSDILSTLLPAPEQHLSVVSATSRLKEVLSNRRCLLVIDDAWAMSDLAPFLTGGERTTRLITTRRVTILPKNARVVEVNVMQGDQAVALLGQELGNLDTADRAALRELAVSRLGEWPVLLRLVNRFMSIEVEAGGSPKAAIASANRRLDRSGLTVFDLYEERARDAAVESTVNASLAYLSERMGRGRDAALDGSARFDELAVFPEDVDVPIGVAARLWRDVAGLDESDSRELLKKFHSLALVQLLDLSRGTFRLHDVMRTYLLGRVAPDGLKQLHRALAGGLGTVGETAAADIEERRYRYAWAPTHLLAAGQPDQLGALLGDMRWTAGKLIELGPSAVILDLERFGNNGDHGALRNVLSASIGVLQSRPQQLIGRLAALGQTAGFTDPDAFYRTAEAALGMPRLVPRHYRESVNKPIVIRLGRDDVSAFSAHGNTLLVGFETGEVARVDPRNGRIAYLQTGVSSSIACLRAATDNTTYAGLRDGTIVRIAEDTGATVLANELGRIASLLVFGGLLVVGAEDRLHIVAREDGEHRQSLIHSGDVTAIERSGDNFILTASADGKLHYWRFGDGRFRHERVLTCSRHAHRDPRVNAVAPVFGWSALVARDDGWLDFPDLRKGRMWRDSKPLGRSVNGTVNYRNRWTATLYNDDDGEYIEFFDIVARRGMGRTACVDPGVIGRSTSRLAQLEEGAVATINCDAVIGVYRPKSERRQAVDHTRFYGPVVAWAAAAGKTFAAYIKMRTYFRILADVYGRQTQVDLGFLPRHALDSYYALAVANNGIGVLAAHRHHYHFRLPSPDPSDRYRHDEAELLGETQVDCGFGAPWIVRNDGVTYWTYVIGALELRTFAPSPEPVCRIEIAGGGHPRFCPLGQKELMLAQYGEMLLLETDSGSPLRSWATGVESRALALERYDENHVAAAFENGLIGIWNARNGALVGETYLDMLPISLIADMSKRQLLVGAQDGRLIEIDVKI